MDIREHKLDLDRESNKEYYFFIDDFSVIQNEINTLNNKLLRFKQPRFFLFCQKKKIKAFLKPMEDVRDLVDNWSKKYTTFLGKPKLSLNNILDPTLGYVHFMSYLGVLNNIISDKFDTIVSNYTIIQDRNSNQINFIIAITSVLLSLFGLLLAIYVLR
jgi:hypothetical protein